MIIATDFDGTLQINGQANVVLINRLKTEQRKGNIIILWTCREGPSLVEAISYLAKYGFKPNFVNKNCPLAVQQMGHDSRKIYADIYIDDKAR